MLIICLISRLIERLLQQKQLQRCAVRGTADIVTVAYSYTFTLLPKGVTVTFADCISIT